MKTTLLTTGIFLFVLFACKHETIAPTVDTKPVPVTGGGSSSNTNPSSPTTPVTGDTVCFNNQVLPLFQTYCASSGCHTAGAILGDDGNFVLTDYFNIMQGISPNNPGNSKYYTVIGGKMPPANSPQLSATQVATIAKWINQGALNTVCSASATCDTTKYTYTNGISQIFSTYCNGCHGTAPGSANVVLSDYASAKTTLTAVTATTFLNAINFKSATPAMNMPPAGQLSSCQVTQITKWVNSGFPQ